MLTPLYTEPSGSNSTTALRLDSQQMLKHHPPESRQALHVIDNRLREWKDYIGVAVDMYPGIPEGGLWWTRCYDPVDLAWMWEELSC